MALSPSCRTKSATGLDWNQTDMSGARLYLDYNATAPLRPEAREAMVALHFGLCLSLLVGAFIASVAAALGGRLRDKH